MKVPEFFLKTLLIKTVNLIANVAVLTLAIATGASSAPIVEQVQNGESSESLKITQEADVTIQANKQATEVVEQPKPAIASPEINFEHQDLLNQIEQYANQGTKYSGNDLLNQIDQYADQDTVYSNNEILNQIEQYANKGTAEGDNELLNQIEQYGNEGEVKQHDSQKIISVSHLTEEGYWELANEVNNNEISGISEIGEIDSISQIQSIAQLSDVNPSDWAYQALKSLVERYGVIAGYPDGTFRGNQNLTRYEFAAAVNASLDRISELLFGGDGPLVEQEDLATLEKLQTEFGSELAVLDSRIGNLEGRINQVQANRFAATAKLFGLGFFNLTGITGGSNTLREIGVRTGAEGTVSSPATERVNNPNVTAGGLVWLNLGASFTGKDLLITQLAAGESVSPASDISSQTSSVNNSGIPFTDASSFLGPDASVVLRELVYEFPVFGQGRLAIGPRINWFRFFDENPFTFFLTGTSSLNSIANPLTSDVRRGAGAILQLPVSEQFRFNVGFLGEANEFTNTNSASDPLEGLFGGTNILTAEVVFHPADNLNLRFLYSRVNQEARQVNVDGSLITDVNGNAVTNTFISGVPINGIADDGAGGSLENAQSNIFEFNFDWLVTRKFGLFGRYGIANTNLNAVDSSRDGNITTQTFQVGFALLDLFKEGAQGTVSFMMPFFYSDGRNFLASGGGDGGTQYELEAVYYYPLTRNIAIVPNLQVLFNFNNFNENPTIYVLNLRTQFTF